MLQAGFEKEMQLIKEIILSNIRLLATDVLSQEVKIRDLTIDDCLFQHARGCLPKFTIQTKKGTQDTGLG